MKVQFFRISWKLYFIGQANAAVEQDVLDSYCWMYSTWNVPRWFHMMITIVFIIIIIFIQPGTYKDSLSFNKYFLKKGRLKRAKLGWQKSNIKSSAVLFKYFLDGFSFSENSRAAKKRNQILYATWWSTYSQGFSASIFPDRGRTYVSDIYHCYIHYFSLLSKEHKNLIFNGTVIDLLLTIFSLFFCVQRIQRFLETQTKYNLKYTSIDNAMLQEFSLLSKESKNLSNRNKNKALPGLEADPNTENDFVSPVPAIPNRFQAFFWLKITTKTIMIVDVVYKD